VVVLDAAHGGADSGTRIGGENKDSLAEKDVTLAIAMRLRSLLTARGFTVVTTRDGTSGAGLSNDQRAELANKAHGVAGLVIHASASGNGVMIGTSTIGAKIGSGIGSGLTGVPESASGSRPGAVLWERAQEAYLPQSQRLANKVGAALSRSNIPISIRPVAQRPLDNLMCPAVSIEIAPQAGPGGDPVPVSDGNYQQRVVDAIAGALVFWRNQAQPPEYVTVPRPDARVIEPEKPTLPESSRGPGS